MQNTCMDSFTTNFGSFPMMLGYHQEQTRNSEWLRCPVTELCVEPLDRASEAFWNIDLFANGTSELAVEDTVENLGLALRVNGELRPIRGTAYKGLLDRAKISGSALAKLGRDDLADVLNRCLQLHQKQQALLLISGEKISAVHSGDEKDYSVLPIDELLERLQENLDMRFEGNVFESGYSSHSLTSAFWKLPNQKKDLLGKYAKHLKALGKACLAHKLVPGVQFITSDTGIASAQVSALLMGASSEPIHLGSCISVDHRRKNTVEDFSEALDLLFAQFGDNIKELVMPKKEAVEAIAMFESVYGDKPATAHDVFMSMQEIPYLLKLNNASESKLLMVQENMARALSLNWAEYDLPKAVVF